MTAEATGGYLYLVTHMKSAIALGSEWLHLDSEPVYLHCSPLCTSYTLQFIWFEGYLFYSLDLSALSAP